MAEDEDQQSNSVPRAGDGLVGADLVEDFVVDVELVEGLWTEQLDLSPLGEAEFLSLYATTTEQPVTLRLRDPETGELLAVSEDAEEVEEDGGDTRFVSKVELNPDAVPSIELEVESELGQGARLAICAEMVVNRDDAGPGSLRDAVSDVLPGLSVCFDPVEFTDATPVELLADIEISKNVTVLGTGRTTSAIDVVGDHRVFDQDEGTRLVVHSLSMYGGFAVDGGLILSHGHLLVFDSALQDSGADYGGAIHSSSGAPPAVVEIRRSLVSGNTAEYGGGLWCEGCDAVIDDAVFDNNTATEFGGSVSVYFGQLTGMNEPTFSNSTAAVGGALYADTSDVTLLERTRLFSNEASLGGGAAFFDYSTVSLEGVEIYENLATEGSGGGLEFYQSDVVIQDGATGWPSQIAYNIAVTGGGISVGHYYGPWLGSLEVGGKTMIALNRAALGGGLFTKAADVTFADDAAVFDNIADYGGGVFAGYQVALRDRAQIRNNTALEYGGGVWNVGTLQLLDPGVRIRWNTAPEAGRGGGVATSSAVAFQPFQIVGNTAEDYVLLP